MLHEDLHLDLEGVEQTFVFDELPHTGGLVLTVDVETELEARTDGSALEFVHPQFGGVRYGEAFAVDALGVRTAVERRFVDGAIQIVVPEEVVAAATLPLTVDPVVSTFTNTFGNPNDDAFPGLRLQRRG